MDFLGLKTLTVIEDTVNLIRKAQSKFEIKDIPLNDLGRKQAANAGRVIRGTLLTREGRTGA